jgi:hypothetical protein
MEVQVIATDRGHVSRILGSRGATAVVGTAPPRWPEPSRCSLSGLLQETLNPLLVQSKAIDRWNGILPQFSGSGTVPFVNLTPS